MVVQHNINEIEVSTKVTDSFKFYMRKKFVGDFLSIQVFTFLLMKKDLVPNLIDDISYNLLSNYAKDNDHFTL